MFKALMGGGRSSSDVRSSTSSSSKSGSRRKSSHGHRSSASSTVSRKSSSRGDDRDRGLGDLSAYPSAGSRSRSARYAESAGGESVASSYATARPNKDSDDRIHIERALKRRESEYDERDDRERDRDRDREVDREGERTKARPDREDSGERDRGSRRPEPQRERTYPEDNYYPPVASGAVPAPFGPMQATQGPPFPMNPVSVPPAAPAAPTPTIYDPHVQQQFPGQFPTSYAEPYRPPNPAGEAADYYNDQGQSVQEQPGVRPKPPLVIPNSQAHLMTASPTANPPPEPSSLGEVGAAASYFANDPALDVENSGHPISGPESRPPKPSDPPKPPYHAAQTTGAMGAAAAAATYGVGNYSPEHVLTESPAAYVPPTPTNGSKPPQAQSHSHGVGAALGGAAAGAAAGYMLGHHHHLSSSSDHISQYTMQNPDVSQIGPGYSGAPITPALYAAGAAGAAAAGAAYAASPLHPHHAAIYHGSPFQGGAMAFQQRQRGPLDKFIDFWRDPEGVGKFEDYTEAIGVCKYCFEPGTTSRDAPRTHHYRRRRSSDRLSAGSRVDKLSRYASSEDEGRRRKSSKSSWLPAILGGYVTKSLFDNKAFDSSYSVKSGRVAGAYPESDSTSDRRSKTSRGVHRRSHRSRSRDRIEYLDQKASRYEGSRISGRSRSRSRSSSRSNRHTLRDAAIGAAIGTAAASVVKSRRERSRSPSRSRSRSPRKPRGRKSSSSSDSSYENISRPPKKTAGGFGTFFTASSENRNKKRRSKRSKSIFSFNNSSSSSVDNDLAFGGGYARKLMGKSKRRSSKEKEKDVDAKLLALGVTATALAASSPRRSRRAGEVFVGQGSRSGRSDYTSSASNDDDWEDMDSDGQASSVSSALAFGASGHFAREDSHSSDSSSSGWGWGWGAKSKKKKNKSKRRSSSPKDRFPTGAVATVAAGALGTAALASGYHRGGKEPSSSSASLQHVAPIPTSDPGRYDAIPVSSFPPPEPQLVRPGAIPLQQPQPVTPVSQAVYTTQGAPIPPFTAPIIPTLENPFPSYESQSREVDRKSSGYVERASDVPPSKSHKRSESTPVIRSDTIEAASEPGLGIKRRFTAKDQASVVQFDLTREQEDKERRVERLERLRRDLGRGDRIELIDREGDAQSAPGGYGSQRPVWEREREREREEEREYSYEREHEREKELDREKERDQVRNWAAPIVAGAIGAAAASTVISEGSSKDDASDMSEKWRQRQEQRRKERREANGSTTVSSVVEEPPKRPDDLPEHPEPRELMEERESSASPSNHVKTSAFRNVSRRKSVYDDYATFFYPEELRHSPTSHSRQETPTMPTIVEIVPASERAEPPPPNPNADYEPPTDFKDFDRLPWPVPVLRVIEPTPPHSTSGSVRGAPSPVITPSEPAEAEREPERPTASRVSWSEHQTHEYEVPSTSSERSSVDLHERQRDFLNKTSAHDDAIGYSYIAPSDAHVEDVNEDIEFAATVAAAAQAAGFDPALVTKDPIFRTRTSPPGSQTRERSISPTTAVSVTAAHESSAPQRFHGFVEGEVDSPSAPKSQFFSDPTPVVFDRPSPFENQLERSWGSDRPTSLDQPVVKHVDRVETEPVDFDKDVSRSIVELHKIQEEPAAERRQESESPGEEEWFMPGGFEPEELKIERCSTSLTAEDVPRSNVSYDATEEKKPEDEPETEPLKQTETEGTDDFNDIPESAIGGEDEGEGKKKKRRMRRSKHESDAFDDSASMTSSVLVESSDKRKGGVDKSKKSGGFLASLFGSRVSEPVDSKRSRSTDKLVSREVQSEIGPATSEDSPRRRRHRHRSSRDSRDSSRADSLDDRRRYDDREFELHRAESFPVEGSRVSEPITRKRSKSIDRLVSRDVQSELGMRRPGDSDSTRRRRHHRTSSGGDSLDGRRRFDDLELDKDGDRDRDDANKENVNVESYKSSRQRREDRRRQRYGNGDGDADGYEKEPTPRAFQDSERNRSFLVERPEMPVAGGYEHGHEYDGTSGPTASFLDHAEGARGEPGLGIISRRPRSHSTTPPSSEKIVLDSGVRSISPGPRRPSLSRFADSPTAVPLHFRPPPASPKLQRSPSVTSLPAVSPVSPSQQGRRSRPNSLEFKNSREIRPLFLVERLGSSKIEQGQFDDEMLPSLPSSKSASTEDLTSLKDENAWEVQQASTEPHHDNLGSQQNTPTRATFGSGVPRHLSRKEELGYEFHSPSELLEDAELSSYPSLPESLKVNMSLHSAQGSIVGMETDLENLPPLPDSRPSSPDDKDDFVSVSDGQMVTPTQEAEAEAEKGAASADRDIPGLDLYSGPGFAGIIDAAMAASSSSSTPYPEAELLAKSKSESNEAEAEGQDDDARTITGNDVPTLADLSPPRSPITDKECEHIRPAPWGSASAVGAVMAADANPDNAAPGDYPATTPSETDKPAESVADTTEDEFFDAMSRDEAADHDVEERAWETDLPSGIETPRHVKSGFFESFVARDGSVTVSQGVEEKGGGLNAEFQPGPQLEREAQAEVETVEAHGPEMIAEPVSAPEPQLEDVKVPELEPATELASEPQPEIIESEAPSVIKNEPTEPTAGLTDTTVIEPVLVPETDPTEAQPKEQQPDAPFSSKKNKKKKKRKGESVDLSDQNEEQSLEAPADTVAYEPASSREDAATVLPEQAPASLIEQPAEEVQIKVSAPEAPLLEETKPSVEETAKSEVPAAEGAESFNVEDTPAPVAEQPAALEKEPTVEEAAPEIVFEGIGPNEAIEFKSTLVEVPQDTPAETGLSKKAKKKKKKAAKPTEQTQEAAVESAPALDRTPEDVLESVVDKELGTLKTEAVVVSEENPVEELAVSTQDVPAECELAEPSESVEPTSVAGQPAETLQPHIPNLEAQDGSSVVDIPVPPIHAQAETALESNEPKQEENDGFPQAEDTSLSRKPSKKNKKKNKRKSTAEAEPEPATAGASQNEPEPQPETSEKAGPDTEASALRDEDPSLIEQEVNPSDAKHILIDAVEGGEAPEPEPETKPEDAVAPLETSGQAPPSDDSKQVADAGTEQQATDAHAVDAVPMTIEDETISSHPVEISETNDSEPHVPELPTIEPDAGGPSSTGRKSKKRNKKKQSISSLSEETSPSGVAGGPETDIQAATPATETTPDVPVETEGLAAPEELPAATTPDFVEETPRDLELPAESADATLEDQAASEAAPMTAAQKKRVKKDKKKKRQSVASEEPEPEAQASEPVTEKELIDVTVQDDTQRPEISEPEVEQTEAVTPVIEDTAFKNQAEEVKELTEKDDEQASADKLGEQIGDEAPATDVPVAVDESTTEAAEPVLEPLQDTATDLAIDGPASTESQPTLRPQEDKVAAAETPAVAEQPIEPAPQDLPALGVDPTATEPTVDTQPTTPKKDSNKKKKKKRQSVSVDEHEAVPANEEDVSESPTEHAGLPSQDAPVEPVPERAAKEGESKEVQTEPAAATDEIQEAEKSEGFSVAAEVTPETSTEQESIRDYAAPELSIETTTDEPSTAQQKDTVLTTDKQETTTPSLPEEPTPDPAQSQEQQQSLEQAEETQTASSKKKNKKKKKKSLSSTSVDEVPATAPQDPVVEQGVAEPQPITETSLTAEPEELAADTAAAVKEHLPSAPEFIEQEPDSKEPISEQPPESTIETTVTAEPEDATFTPEGSQSQFLKSAESEPKEPESQDVLPADEQQTKASKKKAKKDKKKRKSVAFAAEESSEQQGEPSESPQRTEPAVADSTEALEPVPNDAPVKSEMLSEKFPAPSEPVSGNEPVLEQKGKQILEEPTSNDSPLDKDREVSAAEASEDLLKDEFDTQRTEEPVCAPEPEQIEPEAMEPTAETTMPETGLSKKDKKKAKKEKKRQSKLLAPENDNVPSTSTEHARDVETPADEVGPETSELKTDGFAETAFSPAEEDGKDNQSHDTGSRGDINEDLTWTDNYVSSQVEKEQQHTASPDLGPELERESTEVDKGVVEVEHTPITADHDVVEESQQEAGFRPSGSAIVEEKNVSQSEVDTSLGVENPQNESEQKRESEQEASIVLEKAYEEEPKPTTSEAHKAVEERTEEVVPVPTTEAEPVKETEPTQAAKNVAEEPEAGSAVPSRKQSKKQKKKQRQAEKAAASQVQEKETAAKGEFSYLVDLATVDEAKINPLVIEGVEDRITIPEEPTLQETATKATTGKIFGPADLTAADDQPIKPASPEAVQDTTAVIGEAAEPESSWVIVDESKPDAELSKLEKQPADPATPGPVHDTTTSPAPEEVPEDAEIKDVQAVEPEHIAIEQDESLEILAATSLENEPLTGTASLPVDESITNEKTMTKDNTPAVEDKSEEHATDDADSPKGPPVTATEPAMQAEGIDEPLRGQAPGPAHLEPIEQKGQLETVPAINSKAPTPVSAPSEIIELKERTEVVPQVEENAPKVEAPERVLPDATRENEQPKTVPEISSGYFPEDEPREESPAALEEPTLSRKESKKKKKAKKQAKEQGQLEKEVDDFTNAETEIQEDVKAADAVELGQLPVVKPVEIVEKQYGSLVEAAVVPMEEKPDMIPETSVQEEVKVDEERVEVAEDTEKELDVPREAIQEKVTLEAGKEVLLEEQLAEQKLQTELVEPVSEKEIVAAAVQESGNIEPESATTPLSRKMSKKEKRKLKKQAEQQEREVAVETADAVKGYVSVPQAAVQAPGENEEAPMPTELVEVVKEEALIPGPALEPETTKEHEAKFSRELVNDEIPTQLTIESMESTTEPSKEGDVSLSKKLSKKERKKRKGKGEEPRLESQQPELASQPGGQSYDRTLEPVEPQETACEDEDAWPTIDWAKGKIDTTDQSTQSSPEAHAAPFVPEIPEFKESAIPEALIERVDETPEEAARESKAQAMTGTIERDVTTREFNTTSTDSALQALHHVESVQEQKAEEHKTAVPVSDKIASIFPNLERGFFRRPSPNPSPTQSVKDGAEEETMEEASRDSAIQVLEAPIAGEVELQPEVRDSGYIPSPPNDVFGTVSREPPADIEVPGPPETFEPGSRQNIIPEPAQGDDVFRVTTTRELPDNPTDPVPERPAEDPQEEPRSIADTIPESGSACDLRRSPSIHGRHGHQRLPWSLEESAQARRERDISPSPLPPIAEQEPERAMVRDGTPRLEMKPEHVLPQPETPVRKFTENALGRRAWPTPENESDNDWERVQKPTLKNLSPERGSRSGIVETPEQDKPVLRPSRPPSTKSSTHSLRRIVHTASGDLRAAAAIALAANDATVGPALDSAHQSRAATPQPPAGAPTDLDVGEIASSSSYDPVTDKGKKPLRSMTDVYEGWGETPSSPRSPSRPASIRHRRSMQHLQELEFRLEHLLQENRDLAAARDAAEDKLRNASLARRKSDQALNTRDADLRDREAELEHLQQSVEWFQKEVARLNEENTGLTSTHATLIATHTQELQTLQQTSAREIEQLRSQNERLSVDLHERIKSEIETALSQKNAELRRLREELESARDKVKELQQQISAQMNDNVIAFRGEDYFEAACQKLCGHVQQWVLRFSKHSDHRRCRKLIEIKDEKIADRFDNAILDGSDTDTYLADRVRRRDIFMSVVMTMVWEFVFTRYLFGMDREQRQKLKSLEKQLIEVGPRNAIHRWRATTLTLLSRRQAFAKQRDSDTEAVALEIFDTLSRLLPPPTHVESQLLDSLRKVLRVAVSLSIEMRTQLAEYIMLPPLQPEYDTNGDLARQVFFNASLMNERSGETTSNEELQAQNAVVRVVLFPLVVKKGNDAGEGEDEVVVCPAQVLVARPGKDKRLNRMTSGDRISLDASRSVHSIAPSSMNMSMSNVI